MMIQERLERSNLIMLVVPVAVAGVLLALEGAKMMMKRKEQPGVPIVKGAKQA